HPPRRNRLTTIGTCPSVKKGRRISTLKENGHDPEHQGSGSPSLGGGRCPGNRRDHDPCRDRSIARTTGAGSAAPPEGHNCGVAGDRPSLCQHAESPARGSRNTALRRARIAAMIVDTSWPRKSLPSFYETSWIDNHRTG